MTFAEKLDLLMNITNTSNSLLAHSISLDASFISRLRRGVRAPAKNANYIQAMSGYFARCCQAEYQKTALWKAIRTSSPIQPQSTDSMASLIEQWLWEPAQDDSDPIDELLESMIDFRFKRMETAATVDLPIIDNQAIAETEVLHGVKGKRAAVLTFLSLVISNKHPQTLLLFSDEDLSWLTEDPEFTAKWSALMLQVLKNGNRIKMIHTINRNLDEMLSGIKGWIPLYMTGAIEPYYYPKTRDGLFRRTLFIAPDTAAVSSSSVHSGTQNTANFFTTNRDAIRALASEYNNLIALCRPLMRIFNHNHQGNYLETLAEFEEEAGDTIAKTDMLTNITIPEEAAASILVRLSDVIANRLRTYQQRRIKTFYDKLATHRFTEILSLPDLETILAGKAVVNLSAIPNETQVFYTPREYYLHLQNILRLLKTYDNYRIHLTGTKQLEGNMIYVKEDVGVLVGRTAVPAVIFAINESNMTAAFWDYMNVLLPKEYTSTKNRSHTIEEIETLAAQLGGVTGTFRLPHESRSPSP
ncbi:MAG TPA: transcriptional regulator [Peptococcaceae bacterium]|nr:transcriptional regulator [Peptococcaceae bacterium]